MGRTEQLQQRHVGARSTIDDEVIQDLKRLDRSRREAFDLLVLPLALARLATRRGPCSSALDCLPAVLREVIHEDTSRLAAPDGSTLLVLLAFNRTVHRTLPGWSV
jgi:hypothetical protein